MRTRAGLALAKAKGRLRGRQPKLSPRQEAHLVELYRGEKSPAELVELFGVGRSTVYQAIQRALPAQPAQPGEKAAASRPIEANSTNTGARKRLADAFPAELVTVIEGLALHRPTPRSRP